MTYVIAIEGMHCTGCEALIKMSLEDAGFTNVAASLKDKSARFESSESLEQVKSTLDNVFSVFDGYKYTNLNLV